MTLETYAKYISSADGGLYDDSPLGIYDSEFGDAGSPTQVLTEEYSVPECFSEDLFALVDEDEYELDKAGDTNGADGTAASLDSTEDFSRPPWRWILIGPARSGTGMHIDPLWTNAWVTVLQGMKRWMLFPPSCPGEGIGMVKGQQQIPSSIWFRDYYDTVTSGSWPLEWKPIEVLQRPGETVFVPNGWAHAVLNLELTVAVTHNYASEFGPFERMWQQVVVDEPCFAKRWNSALKRRRPDLAQRAKEWHLSHAHEAWTGNVVLM